MYVKTRLTVTKNKNIMQFDVFLVSLERYARLFDAKNGAKKIEMEALKYRIDHFGYTDHEKLVGFIKASEKPLRSGRGWIARAVIAACFKGSQRGVCCCSIY
jgi:hypothetical protein